MKIALKYRNGIILLLDVSSKATGEKGGLLDWRWVQHSFTSNTIIVTILAMTLLLVLLFFIVCPAKIRRTSDGLIRGHEDFVNCPNINVNNITKSIIKGQFPKFYPKFHLTRKFLTNANIIIIWFSLLCLNFSLLV